MSRLFFLTCNLVGFFNVTSDNPAIVALSCANIFVAGMITMTMVVDWVEARR